MAIIERHPLSGKRLLEGRLLELSNEELDLIEAYDVSFTVILGASLFWGADLYKILSPLSRSEREEWVSTFLEGHPGREIFPTVARRDRNVPILLDLYESVAPLVLWVRQGGTKPTVAFKADVPLAPSWVPPGNWLVNCLLASKT